MTAPVIHLALALLATLLCSQVSSDVSKCNATITGSMSTLHPYGRPKNIINTLMGHGKYSYVFLSSCDETEGGQTCLEFQVKSEDTGVMTYTLPDSTIVSKKFPIAEGNDGKGYIVQTNNSLFYKLYLLFQKDHVICTYRCCKTCTGTKPDVGCAVANSHRKDPKTKAALKEGLKLLISTGLADNLVFLKRCYY